MAFQRYPYAVTPSNLEGINWETDTVYAQLLNITYTFSTSHETRNNIISAVVASPLEVTSKTKVVSGLSTFLSCSQLQFPNTPSAKWVAILIGNPATPIISDKLLGVIDLNDGVAAEVIVNFGIGFNGGMFTLRNGA